MDMSTEPLYSAEQIHFPAALPNILKDFTKAAIRAQPKDTLVWAARCVRVCLRVCVN